MPRATTPQTMRPCDESASMWDESHTEVAVDLGGSYCSDGETASTYDESDAEVVDDEEVEDATDGMFHMRMADPNTGHEPHNADYIDSDDETVSDNGCYGAESDVGRIDYLREFSRDNDVDVNTAQPTGPSGHKRCDLVFESAVGEKEDENAFG